MNWKQQAKQIFNVSKPVHFGNFQHCSECAEHDQTLSAYDVDTIGLEQLGKPSWDPISYASVEGRIYYLPAQIRLTVDTIESPQESYLDQMLFHLMLDGPRNRLVMGCTREQREFIASFLEYLIDNYSGVIDADIFYPDDILRAHEIWSEEF